MHRSDGGVKGDRVTPLLTPTNPEVRQDRRGTHGDKMLTQGRAATTLIRGFGVHHPHPTLHRMCIGLDPLV